MTEKLYEQYKQTIMDVLTCWEELPLFKLNTRLCNYLSELLDVDLEVLRKEKKSFPELCRSSIDYYVSRNAYIFNLYMKYAVTKLNLKDVIDPDNVEMVGLFLSGLRESVGLLTTSNSDLMIILNEELDLGNVLFDDSDNNPISLVKSIQLWASICTEENEQQICQFIGFMARLCKYEIDAQFEALYIMTVLSMISSSDYFDEAVKQLAQKVKDYLFFILKNGKILGININILSPHVSSEFRTRNDDTTRFQIIYSYGNYDAYCLRFDLPHEGVDYTHINNISPGGIKSCLLSEEEYRKLISNNATLEKCFIKYGGQYAIRENALHIDGVDNYELQKLIRSKEHQDILSVTYSEDAINSLTEILSYCLSDKYKRRIDTNGEYATNVFHYNLVMRNLYATVLCFEVDDKKSVEKLLESIGEMAYYWRLTNCPKINDYKELYELIDTLKEKAEQD